MSAGDEENGGDNPREAAVWPEVERAERLARGAALKWASGVFCQPEHLERLSQYRKRESQRTASVHARLKSMVQSYLEGVGWGLEQLREARTELKEVSHTLKAAGLESDGNMDCVKSLDRLREVSINHRQLLAAVSNLPRLYSVQSMVLETERLVESRRLLEAHARLMDLEWWQDDILWQLHGAAGTPGSALSSEDQELVVKYFSGVGQLVDALAKELWAVVSSSLALARQNPTPFVSAVRIVEREEALDRALLAERGGSGGSSRPLPPGRPRCWRATFFQVLEEAVSARFRSVSYLHTRGPGLAGHLSALQHGIMTDLATVRHLLEHCVPTHYQLTAAYLRASHHCLHTHLAQVSSWDLESGEIFAVLNWVLHIYNSPDMMGHPELVTDMERSELGPLISSEGLEQLQSKYVQSVQSAEVLQQQQASRSAGQFSRTPPNPLAALDRAVRRACRLVMDQLLLELQLFLPGLLTRPWLAQGDPTPKLCSILERHLELYGRVRPPCRRRLQEEAQWLMVVEYVRAVMQKKLVCRSGEERMQLAQQMLQDNQLFREVFHILEGSGSDSEVNPLTLLSALADFVRLKDPGMLTLEVSGLAAKYPDISDEHVSVLLDIRGDVSRDIRGAVMDLLEQSAPPLPAGYRPIFTEILVPPSTLAFCLPTAKCA
uniref:Exocyst complex component 3-like 1 n=1 Tax=Nothobranchius kadleci TaxID=1051664 RepID=A0A1A8CBU4_NOTKA